MPKNQTHSFKFLNDGLNRRLVGLLNVAGIDHTLDEHGVVHYPARAREVVENDLIGSIRDQIYPSWQLLTCPREWIDGYRDYMCRHDVPNVLEQSDGELWFLIPRKYRPHSWKLAAPVQQGRLVPSLG